MSQTTQSIEGKVKDIIASCTDRDASGINRTDSFEDLNVDSLETTDIIWQCEQEFNLSIPDEEVEKINTVEQLITYLEAQ